MSRPLGPGRAGYQRGGFVSARWGVQKQTHLEVLGATSLQEATGGTGARRATRSYIAA